MANIKISQLPFIGATYNLDTIFPIVYQGITYQTNLTSLISVIASGGIQQVSNITQSIYADGTSTVKYPSAIAVKTYADGLVVGLLDDRGNYTPGVVSPGAYPSTGGSGTAGAVLKGDLWFIDAAGYLDTIPVVPGQSVRALVNTPGQTTANWDILDIAGFINPPETTDNKVISEAEFIANGTSIVKYPSVLAVKDYIDNQVTLQGVLDNNHDLVDGINLQGTTAGTAMAGGVTNINAFGTNAASGNLRININALGNNAANANNGDNLNAMGENAGLNNQGQDVNAFGGAAALGNNGGDVNAMGYSATESNLGGAINAFGREAAFDNSGNNVNAFGNRAAVSNLLNADDVNALGYEAAKDNQGTSVNALGYMAGVSNPFNHVTLLGKNASADSDNQLVFTKDGTTNMRLDANGINADRKLTMPDADGTVVLSVNGNTANPQGEVTLTIPTPTPELPYLCYAALLQFSRILSLPIVTATQLYNTIGDGSGDGVNDISWTTVADQPSAVMASGPFNAKTVVIPGNFIAYNHCYSTTGQVVSSTRLGVSLFDINAMLYQFPTISNVYVEIRIYP
jgi:hypothetical protein